MLLVLDVDVRVLVEVAAAEPGNRMGCYLPAIVAARDGAGIVDGDGLAVEIGYHRVVRNRCYHTGGIVER